MLCLCGALLAMAPAMARADTVGLLPVGGDLKHPGRNRKQLATEARQHVVTQLRRLKHRFILDDQVQVELKKYYGTSCEDLGCAHRVFKALPELDVVLEVRVAVEKHRPIAVIVEAVRRDNRRGKSTQKVERRHLLGRACGDATEQALIRSSIQDTRQVNFIGEPHGAVLIVGGKPLGNLPLTAPVAVGRQSLVVQHADHPPLEMELTVPGGVGTYRYVIDLAQRRAGPSHDQPGVAPGQAVTVPQTRRATGRSTLNLVGPITLGLAGAASTGVGIFGLALSDSCGEENSEGECDRLERSNTGVSIGYLGLGIAAIGGAVVWFALTGDDDEEKMQVGLGPNRLQVRGRF